MTRDQRLWENANEIANFPLIFKYYSMEIGLNAIKESTLQFSHSSRFNDPFDCNASLFKSTQEDIEAFYHHIFLKHAKGNVEKQKQFEKNYQAKIKPNFEKFMMELIEKENSNRGISCFSKISNNLLMWAHYASNHKGMCIGYDTIKLIDFMKQKNGESALLNINYVRKIEPKMYFLEKEHSIDYWLTTKHIHWKYEKEIRLISKPFEFGPEKKTIINIPQEIIKEVTFGYSSDNQTKLDIIKLVSSKMPHVEFFQIKPNYQTFKLERNKISK